MSQLPQQISVTLQHTLRRLVKSLIVDIDDLLGSFDLQQKVQHLGSFLWVKGFDLINHVCRCHTQRLPYGIELVMFWLFRGCIIA